VGIVIFLTLPSLLFFGFVYLRYHENLPTGSNPEQADVLAHKMLDALNYEAYQNTNYIEWLYKKRRYYRWRKNEQTCVVYWEDYKVELDLANNALSTAYIHNFAVEGDIGKKLIDKALGYFNNDSFWLVAPYKVFDEGTERRIVTLDNGSQGLLVTYNTDDSPHGKSYLWHLDEDGKPISFQMWGSGLPIDGLKASWTDWVTTESGAQLPTLHKVLIFGIELRNVEGTK